MLIQGQKGPANPVKALTHLSSLESEWNDLLCPLPQGKVMLERIGKYYVFQAFKHVLCLPIVNASLILTCFPNEICSQVSIDKCYCYCYLWMPVSGVLLKLRK